MNSQHHHREKDKEQKLGERIISYFIGIYVKAIFNICKLNTHYSVPEALKDSKQQIIRAVVNSPEGSDRLHLVIENEFYVKNKPIKLWCLISPTRNTFREALERIESRETYH